ncbi:MAG: hypothetical protein ILA13_05525 [Eubacterium sp.]|nr:hypothetical protein [Eubacterium sp.]
MLPKYIKTPILVSIALRGFAYLLVILLTLGQSSAVKLVSGGDFEGVGTVIPLSLFTSLIILLETVVFYLVMRNYEGNSRRTVEIVMFIASFVISALSTIAVYVYNVVLSRQGVDSYAMAAQLNQVINLSTAPFNSVATVLMIVAIARYGISDIAIDDRNSLSIEP